MRKLLGLLIILLWAISAQAQTDEGSSKSINITINATVVQRIEMRTIRDMNIGNVQPGQKTINIDPTTASDAGKMIASGRPNARIPQSFPQSWDLSNPKSNNPASLLSFNYKVAGNTVNDRATAEILEPDNRSIQFSKEGTYYLWIGGTVDIANAEPGQYKGQFTVEIEYL